jgi:hypothetical protein
MANSLPGNFALKARNKNLEIKRNLRRFLCAPFLFRGVNRPPVMLCAHRLLVNMFLLVRKQAYIHLVEMWTAALASAEINPARKQLRDSLRWWTTQRAGLIIVNIKYGSEPRHLEQVAYSLVYAG